jgi:hypothetical protein
MKVDLLGMEMDRLGLETDRPELETDDLEAIDFETDGLLKLDSD